MGLSSEDTPRARIECPQATPKKGLYSAVKSFNITK